MAFKVDCNGHIDIILESRHRRGHRDGKFGERVGVGTQRLLAGGCAVSDAIILVCCPLGDQADVLDVHDALCDAGRLGLLNGVWRGEEAAFFMAASNRCRCGAASCTLGLVCSSASAIPRLFFE